MSCHLSRRHTPYTRDDVAVRNNASRMSYEKFIIGEGAHRYVKKGVYTEGERRGQPAVCKEFKTGEVFEEHYFKEDIRATRKAEFILADFMNYIREHQSLKYSNIMIKINIPGIWESVAYPHAKCLVEPYIQNFKKFNSNTGASDPEFKVAQALSHFSYHITGEECVLCDLQGGASFGFDERQRVYTLSDVVVLSKSRSYGATDLGEDGINNFFHHHRCNEFCNSTWRVPAFTRNMYVPVMTTTFSTAGLLGNHGPSSSGSDVLNNLPTAGRNSNSRDTNYFGGGSSSSSSRGFGLNLGGRATGDGTEPTINNKNTSAKGKMEFCKHCKKRHHEETTCPKLCTRCNVHHRKGTSCPKNPMTKVKKNGAKKK